MCLLGLALTLVWANINFNLGVFCKILYFLSHFRERSFQPTLKHFRPLLDLQGLKWIAWFKEAYFPICWTFPLKLAKSILIMDQRNAAVLSKQSSDKKPLYTTCICPAIDSRFNDWWRKWSTRHLESQIGAESRVNIGLTSIRWTQTRLHINANVVFVCWLPMASKRAY